MQGSYLANLYSFSKKIRWLDICTILILLFKKFKFYLISRLWACKYSIRRQTLEIIHFLFGKKMTPAFPDAQTAPRLNVEINIITINVLQLFQYDNFSNVIRSITLTLGNNIKYSEFNIIPNEK